ncbi:MAG: hypothetical protein OK441_06120 [Thaumarchaeota archaeon]|nr:hypothetical protein [Nitrososphaerota archaeon]
MLSSSMLREEVDSIVELVAQGHADEARQKLNGLIPHVSSEYGRGAALALNGILHVIENKSTDRMADREKILRATERIPKSQTLDDMDKGYLQTISKWAKKTKETAKDQSEGLTKDSANAAQP